MATLSAFMSTLKFRVAFANEKSSLLTVPTILVLFCHNCLARPCEVKKLSVVTFLSFSM